MKKVIIAFSLCFAMLSTTTASAGIFFKYCFPKKPIYCAPKPKPCAPKPKPCAPKPKPCYTYNPCGY